MGFAQRRAFGLDFRSGSDPEAAEGRDWRTPALQGVLEQERGNGDRQDEPAPVADGFRDADQPDDCGVGLERPLHVPLFIQLAQPLANFVPMGAVVGDVRFRAPPDPLVHALGGVPLDALGREDAPGTAFWACLFVAIQRLRVHQGSQADGRDAPPLSLRS